MTNNEALEIAIQSILTQRDETYEGDELLDPDIIVWQQKMTDAANVLKQLKV